MSVRIEAVHPVLMARDVETSLRFYAGLGFGERFRDRAVEPRYAVVARDGAELHLQWADEGQWIEGLDRPSYRFLVSDVDALYDELRRAHPPVGREPAGPWAAPAETPWGTREFHVRDPGGNGLQFYRPADRRPAPGTR